MTLSTSNWMRRFWFPTVVGKASRSCIAWSKYDLASATAFARAAFRFARMRYSTALSNSELCEKW